MRHQPKPADGPTSVSMVGVGYQHATGFIIDRPKGFDRDVKRQRGQFFPIDIMGEEGSIGTSPCLLTLPISGCAVSRLREPQLGCNTCSPSTMIAL